MTSANRRMLRTLLATLAALAVVAGCTPPLPEGACWPWATSASSATMARRPT